MNSVLYFCQRIRGRPADPFLVSIVFLLNSTIQLDVFVVEKSLWIKNQTEPVEQVQLCKSSPILNDNHRYVRKRILQRLLNCMDKHSHLIMI